MGHQRWDWKLCDQGTETHNSLLTVAGTWGLFASHPPFAALGSVLAPGRRLSHPLHPAKAAPVHSNEQQQPPRLSHPARVR